MMNYSDTEQQELARQARLEPGYFDEATRDLRSADSPTKRAAAAHKLGWAESWVATAHLVAALFDGAPEVRRAAVEGLGHLRDPAAIAPLNDLLARETSSQLPESAIRHSIHAIAFVELPIAVETPVVNASENERPPAPQRRGTLVDEGLTQEDERLLLMEDALSKAIEAIEALECQDLKVSGRTAAVEGRLKTQKEAAASSNGERHRKAAKKAHIRAELESRDKVEEEERRLIAQRSQANAEEEALHQAEEGERFHVEAETLRHAAEELARKRSMAEAVRKEAGEIERQRTQTQAGQQAEEETSRRTEEALRKRAEEAARQRAEQVAHRPDEKDALRQTAKEKARRRVEEAAHLPVVQAAEGAQTLAGLEAERQNAEEQSLQRVEKERRIRAEIEDLRQAEAEQRRRIEEVEARRRTQAQQLSLETESLKQTALELERQRLEIDTARKRSEEETQLLIQDQEVFRVEPDAHLKAEEERHGVEPTSRRIRAEIEELESGEEVPRGRLQSKEETRHGITEGERRMVVENSSNTSEATQSAADVPQRTVAAVAGQHVSEAVAEQTSPWLEVDLTPEEHLPVLQAPPLPQLPFQPLAPATPALEREIELHGTERGIATTDVSSSIPFVTLNQLNSSNPAERSAALHELAERAGLESFDLITASFDDPSPDVRNAAAHALYDLQSDRAASFTRALRAASSERRRRIGTAIAESGLAKVAINDLSGEGRERTYAAFALLFLMAKAGEVHSLMHAIEDHQSTEVRLAIIRLLALSGQPEIVPAFRRLVMRGALSSEVRSVVMTAIYQLSSPAGEGAPSVA